MEPIEALRRYWGYDAFRANQEAVIRCILEGRDAAVVLPTGGGKSLCYQVPAVIMQKTAVVISPLIALMQDQVEQLAQMGISAAVLNSATPPSERAAIMRNAIRGEYRLLYLSPERAVMPQTIDWLRRAPVAYLSIDEAHCISEWGHEFRPEYRQLGMLRDAFPGRPIAAFTASATQRVRHDIIAQLRLAEPGRFITSFHRPNLSYLVRKCDGKTQPRYLLNTIAAHPEGSIIVYVPTIASVDSTVSLLAQNGIPAAGYHGQMSPAARASNQERWMQDEVRVLVGTVAFGLGINKPSVRAVIHLSLPKSIEQYYQEAGRAGRDGLPSQCVLLWRPQDKALLAHFVTQLEDKQEQSRAWERWRDISGFVESTACRPATLCRHFGERPKWQRCEQCDNCGFSPEWLTATQPAAVLKVPAAPAKRSTPTATPPPASPVDRTLFEALKTWRTQTAKDRKVPAYVILHDSSLEDLCRKRPRTRADLLHVSGFGERKSELYGDAVLSVIASSNQ